ncbi:MAG: MMPL family transporter [bacterium]|nr:MMPL family transporter [bacterium]
MTSIVPILLVVAWVYGYMFLVDLAINPITATIAAIAIGVGIDFATHITVRSREEFEGEPGRFPAIRRAEVGTGGALVTSRKGDERTRLLELHPDQWRSTISTPGVAQSRTDAEGVAGCP